MTDDLGPQHLIDAVLRLLREHLDLDVAFVSQLTDGLRVFRHVDQGDTDVLEVGAADPQEESYCHHVVAGRMPQFLADPSRHDLARGLAVTAELPVGTHFSVPLHLSDGSLYGTFCGFSHRVLDHVDERDLGVVRLLAGLVTVHVEEAERERRVAIGRRDQLRALGPAEMQTVVQPIVTVPDRAVVGFEALTRFPGSGQNPAEVFGEAFALGVGEEVELAAARNALAAFERIPADAWLTINVAPSTLCDPRLVELLVAVPADRLVLEITEHAPVTHYPTVLRALAVLRALGVRLAIDDVGTGFSGLDHILRLEPELLKIDGALVRDVDVMAAKQAMVASLVAFAAHGDVTVIAEQVETGDELAQLAALGVTNAQGYWLGRPTPIDP